MFNRFKLIVSYFSMLLNFRTFYVFFYLNFLWSNTVTTQICVLKPQKQKPSRTNHVSNLSLDFLIDGMFFTTHNGCKDEYWPITIQKLNLPTEEKIIIPVWSNFYFNNFRNKKRYFGVSKTYFWHFSCINNCKLVSHATHTFLLSGRASWRNAHYDKISIGNSNRNCNECKCVVNI